MDKPLVDWLDWAAKKNVKLEPFLSGGEVTKWTAAVICLARDGSTNFVSKQDPVGRGRSPLEALEDLYAQMEK